MLAGSISSFADANRTVGDAVDPFLEPLRAEGMIWSELAPRKFVRICLATVREGQMNHQRE
jgi:hypothetical protein